jgi:hypothetical protein
MLKKGAVIVVCVLVACLVLACQQSNLLARYEGTGTSKTPFIQLNGRRVVVVLEGSQEFTVEIATFGDAMVLYRGPAGRFEFVPPIGDYFFYVGTESSQDHWTMEVWEDS